MADLIVRIDYESKSRQALLTLLRTTFPIWGIVAPIAGVISIFILVSMIHPAEYQAPLDALTFYKLLGVAIGGSFTSVACLVATRALSHEAIVADRNGLLVPATWTRLRSYFPWNNITSAKVLPANADAFQNQTLMLATFNGKTISLRLSRLAAQQ